MGERSKRILIASVASDANPYLTVSARCAPARGTLFLARKIVVSETFTSYSPSTSKRPLATLKKRTDSKKGPLFGHFGRKTGGWAREKSILFCTFSRFGGFLLWHVIVGQALADSARLQKKSCLKTSRRFFDFREL
jgi:hypothetical protein